MKIDMIIGVCTAGVSPASLENRMRIGRKMVFIIFGIWLSGMAFAANDYPSSEMQSEKESLTVKSHQDDRTRRQNLKRNQWFNTPEVFIIAHRGASGYAPENTVPSFKKAVEMGSPGCELDVHLSKDGKIIVIHDSTLERTTNGEGKVGEINSEELKKLDAGEKFDPEFKGTVIPYLSEMIDAIKGKSILVCEIKSGAIGHEEKILSIFKEKQIEDAVVIISFSEEALKNVRKLDRNIVTMFLKGSPSEKVDGQTIYHPIPLSVIDEAEELDVDALNLHYKGVTPELVEAAHQRGIKVYCYTVNSLEEAQDLIEMGVDGITGNYPDRLQEALKN